MFKHWQWLVLWSVVVVLVLGGSCFASGIVTFQLEVIPGFSVSAPSHLAFPPIIPGQVSQAELTLQVWSNVRWNLSIRVTEGGMGEGFYGILEVRQEGGQWSEFIGAERTVFSSKMPTGEQGIEVSVPVRFHGSYRDTPGDYSIQVELTVVPAI